MSAMSGMSGVSKEPPIRLSFLLFLLSMEIADIADIPDIKGLFKGVFVMLSLTERENQSRVKDELRCQFIKTDGAQCKGNRIKGLRFCFAHEPSKEKARKIARQAGGRHSHRAKYKPVLAIVDPDLKLRTAEDGLNLLEKTANLFLRGKIDIDTSRELRQTVETFVKVREAITEAGTNLDEGEKKEDLENISVEELVQRIKEKRKIIEEDLKVLLNAKSESVETVDMAEVKGSENDLS